MVNAAQKALEGFEGMPDNIRAVGYKVIDPHQFGQEGNKQDIIKNQQNTLNFSLLADSIRKADHEATIHYMRNVLKTRQVINPEFYRCMVSVFADLKKAKKYKELVQLSELLVQYYTVRDEVLSDPDREMIAQKRRYYAELSIQYKKFLWEEIHKTLEDEVKFNQCFTLDAQGELIFQVKAIHQEALKNIKSLPISFSFTPNDQCMINGWYELSAAGLKALLMDLKVAVESKPVVQQQTELNVVGSSAEVQQKTSFDMQELQLTLSDIATASTENKSKGAKKKKPPKTSQKPLPLTGLINKLNQTLTAGEVGFTKVPEETPIYPVSGKYIAKGRYYNYGIDPSLKIDTQRRANQGLLEAGEIVPKGKPGLRFLSANEKRKHGKDTIMKIAIPHQNLRIGLVEEETRVTGDGKTITLCNAKTTWRH